MITLLLETSTELGAVALFKGKELVYHGKLPFGLQNSKYLFTEIEKAFTVSGLKPTDLQLIVAGIGPGSYTGIRVGAMAAKTLSFALKIPLVGVCSLEAFLPQEDTSFASIMDARIGGVYLQTGVFKDDVVLNLSSPDIYNLEKAVELLREINTLVTPNSALLKPKLEKLAPEIKWNWITREPDPNQMLLSALSKYERGEFSLDGHLDLLYLRKTQAETEAERP